MYFTYKVNCKINNKPYIGWTEDFDKRRYSHLLESKNVKQPSYNTVFHKAIRKYGEKNFEWEILYTTNDLDVAKYMEKWFILEYNSHYIDGYGYNMTYGGDGTVGIIRNEIVRKNMSDAQTGKKLSPKHKAAIKEALSTVEMKEHLRQKALEQFSNPANREYLLGRLGLKNPVYGRIWINKNGKHKRIEPIDRFATICYNGMEKG
jgi:group I intron endonuclease